MKQTTVRFTDWEFEQLQAIAHFENRKINQVIRDTLYEYARADYQEAKNFVDSVDNGMLNPTTTESEQHLKKLYQHFSGKCKVMKPLHDELRLQEEYADEVDITQGEK